MWFIALFLSLVTKDSGRTGWRDSSLAASACCPWDSS